MSLEFHFPRPTDRRRPHFATSLREAFVPHDTTHAHAVHFGHHVDTDAHEIHSDMSPRDIVAALSR
nr:hypothetical protein [Corynebacterium lactis]